MTKLLCHINDEGFKTKPTDIKFMGKLRDKMIQSKWSYIPEHVFIDKICTGHAWYGCLFNGQDLMETGRQRECWRAQTIVAVDFDKCPIDPVTMCELYRDLGLNPWLCYTTFSDKLDGPRSYRVLWRVEIDHSIKYEQWAEVIKALSTVTSFGDKRACDCTRMWQGGPSIGSRLPWWVPGFEPVPYEKFTSVLELQ